MNETCKTTKHINNTDDKRTQYNNNIHQHITRTKNDSDNRKTIQRKLKQIDIKAKSVGHNINKYNRRSNEYNLKIENANSVNKHEVHEQHKRAAHTITQNENKPPVETKTR